MAFPPRSLASFRHASKPVSCHPYRRRRHMNHTAMAVCFPIFLRQKLSAIGLQGLSTDRARAHSSNRTSTADRRCERTRGPPLSRQRGWSIHRHSIAPSVGERRRTWTMNTSTTAQVADSGCRLAGATCDVASAAGSVVVVGGQRASPPFPGCSNTRLHVASAISRAMCSPAEFFL